MVGIVLSKDKMNKYIKISISSLVLVFLLLTILKVIYMKFLIM